MDEGQIAERILDYLEQIGQALADLAPEAKRIAMQAVYADAVGELFTVLGIIMFAALLVWAGYRLRHADYENWSSDDEEMLIFVGWMISLCGGAVSIITMVPLSNLVKILVAPEYTALRKIVGLLTGASSE